MNRIWLQEQRTALEQKIFLAVAAFEKEQGVLVESIAVKHLEGLFKPSCSHVRVRLEKEWVS